MQYTFLISKTDGKILRFQPTESEAWLPKETTENFERHTLDVDEATAWTVQQDCLYDTGQNAFVYKEGGEVFETNGAVAHRSDFSVDDKQKNTERAERVQGGTVSDPVGFINPEHRSRFGDTRKYWLKASFSHRKNPKVNEFLEAVKYGCYGHIFERFEKIDPPTQEDILNSVSDEDRAWAEYILLRGPKP